MKVVKKQTNSTMCLICGMNNALGLHASFYEMEDNTLVSLFTFKDVHQSYPERTHGGMISSLLDELIGRAIWIHEPDVWGVTATIQVKFRKPVPYDIPLKGIAKITENKSRLFKGEGLIQTLDGVVLAEASAVYVKLSLTNIVVDNNHHEGINVYIEDDVKEI